MILSAGAIADCVHFTRKPDGQLDLSAAMAALQFLLAHELAHLYLEPSVSWQLCFECMRAYAACMHAGLPAVL